MIIQKRKHGFTYETFDIYLASFHLFMEYFCLTQNHLFAALKGVLILLLLFSTLYVAFNKLATFVIALIELNHTFLFILFVISTNLFGYFHGKCDNPR